MCSVTLRDRQSYVELRERLGIQRIGDTMHKGRMRWYGHVMMRKDSRVKKSIYINVYGRIARDKPSKTWVEVLRDDKV